MTCIIAFAFGGLLFLNGEGTAGDLVDRIVAVVNGEIIALSEVQESIKRMQLQPDLPTGLSKNSGGGKATTVSLERETLNNLIERKVQLQMAHKKGITVDPKEVDQLLRDTRNQKGLHSDSAFQKALAKENLTLESYKKDLEIEIMILKLINREIKSGILLDEKEVQDYYNNHMEEYMLPDEFHLRQFRFTIPRPELRETVLKEARLLVEKIRAGADFNQISMKDLPTAKGGSSSDLGFLEKGQMRPEVEEAVHGLSPGEVSNPVETPSGIHIFFLEEVKTLQFRSYGEMKTLIRDKIFEEKAAQRYKKWLQDIRNMAQVEIKVQF